MIVDTRLAPDELHEALKVPLETALKGVIFGQGFREPKSSARDVAKRLGADAPEFFRLNWSRGAAALSDLTI
jgi:hypothetical protein